MVSDAEVTRAKDDYKRALDILMLHRRETERAEKMALVGKYFKHLHRSPGEPMDTWPVYIVVTGFDHETEKLAGWIFQVSTSGLIEITTDADLTPGFFADQCSEIPRNDFVCAFNELLTTVARFSQLMPA